MTRVRKSLGLWVFCFTSQGVDMWMAKVAACRVK